MTEILVALVSRVGDDRGTRRFIREGHRYRADSAEVSFFGARRFAEDGASTDVVRAARAALLPKDTTPRKAPRPERPAPTTATALRGFAGPNGRIRKGQRLAVGDPAVVAHPDAFAYR